MTDTPAAPRARRRERLRDAIRMLPLLGVALLLLPDLALSGGPAGEGATAGWWLYLFAAWALLIGLCWLTSRRLAAAEPPGDDVS